jgi:hypothetical protein
MRAGEFKWDHEIQIALPPGYYETNKSYPVLWVTDGSGLFEPAILTLATERKHLPDMILIAVGVPADEVKEGDARRLFDFTPTNAGPAYDGLRKYKTPPGDHLPHEFGGGPRFLSFLVDKVRPALAREYRMNGQHTLFGNSGGGIFCTYAFLARPEAFDRYICGSPALNWGNQELFHMEARYAQSHKDLPAKVFFAAGESEILEDGPMSIASSMALMSEILKSRGYPSLKLYARVFPGEDHLSVELLNLRWGLRTLWATP